MRSICVYGHGGCANHGNEAIVRGLKEVFSDYHIELFSFLFETDKEFGLDEVATIYQNGIRLKKYDPVNIINHLYKRYTDSDFPRYLKLKFKHIIQHDSSVFLLEAGDQYCENSGHRKFYAYINKQLKKEGKKTVAYGCSIDPEVLKDKSVIEDLNRYSLILPRESVTYEALCNAEIHTKISQISDPAFVMRFQEVPLSDEFLENKVVGINSGPLSQGLQPFYDLFVRNNINLIEYLLKNTDLRIALIPHVHWGSGFSDLTTLSTLYELYRGTGRVFLIPIQNAMKLKYIISKCRFMISLRTHASIAAYSSCVPTLVTGYLTKSSGIATDIFGTDENYIVPVSHLKEETQIRDAFKWFLDNEEKIRGILTERIPSYIKRAFSAKKLIEALFE
jgi:polysaccharide pyruvyl transferase WcaK-like protein